MDSYVETFSEHTVPTYKGNPRQVSMNVKD